MVKTIELFKPGRIPVKRKKRAKPDHGLLTLLIEHLKKDAQWTRIETAIVALGVPDGEACFTGGRQVWVETKWTKGWKVRFSGAEQVGWHLKRHRMGGRSVIAVQRTEDELWLIEGSMAAVLAESGLKGPAGASAAVWRGGPEKWRWDEIRIYLAEGSGWLCS